MNKILATLHDSDIFPGNKSAIPSEYLDRQTVKAIVLDDEGLIALVTNKVHELLTLPGGGAESNDLETEIKRECLEEINYSVDITDSIGETIEYRNRDAKKYTTTCFLAKITKKADKDTRTPDEIENGLSVVWVSKSEIGKIFEEQIKKLNAGEITFYNTAFNIKRDYIFIEKFLEIR